MLIYVAGPYRSTQESKSQDENIENAKAVAIKLWDQGHAVVCPHTNSGDFDKECKLTDDQWLAGTIDLLRRCDAMVLVPGWKSSVGTQGEVEFAKSHNIPIYNWAEKPVIPLHPTEAIAPIQSRAFLDVIMSMYRMHLSKNHDYSAANVLGTGEIGVTVRLWDKIARLMNLTGFRFEVSNPRFEIPKIPKYESVEDTLHDTAVYSVIALLVRRGLWGK
jgi:Domain of unknown function (DUF4406)